VNADIAGAVTSYTDATGDHEFTRRTGLDVQTATAGSGGRSARTTRPAAFGIDSVTG
jgi:trehalose/maltose hydrolase-like predicted phosphorylase